MANEAMWGGFDLPIAEIEDPSLFPLTHDTTSTDATSLATVQYQKTGDVAVVQTTLNNVVVKRIGYWWDGTAWQQLNGEIDADNVYLTEDITLAGNYSQVGNIVKNQTGTATFSTAGKTLKEVLDEIFYKVVQPTIVSEPEIGEVVINKAGYYEVGTDVGTVTANAPAFSAGEYSFGPATGVTPTFTVVRVANGTETTITSADGSISDTPGALADGGEIYYKVQASYTQGVVAKDNVGEDSNPVVRIAAGSDEVQSDKIIAYRKAFFGCSTNRDAVVDSAFIRGLTGTTEPFVADGELRVSVAANSNLVVIAYPATLGDLTEIVDTYNMGANLIDVFTKTVVSVEGANGAAGVNYNVYVYRPYVSLGRSVYVARI